MSSKLPEPEWVIVSFKEPVLWDRSENETWMFNPQRRYILNKNQVESLGDKVDTTTLLKNSRLHNPLLANRNLANSSILVERHRDRGFGDYLFLTGPLNYIKHISGGSANIDVYALCDRGKILDHNPALRFSTALSGPIEYDSLHLYNYHWFIDSVTEYDMEPDQANVYDALYKQLGVEPQSVDPRFKRPSMTLVNQDYKDLDSLYYFVYLQKKIDLRKMGYYVVCPTANANLRSGLYQTWLGIIAKLSKIRPVVVLGQSNSVRAPATDMAYGTFMSHLDNLGQNVINLTGATPIRVACGLISRAACAVTLDSGLLYVAQALRVPAVSIWGPVSPWSRIGYDKDYMDLAIWNREACRFAGCSAYSGFPKDKCPRGESQVVCEPIHTVTVEQVIDKVKYVEKRLSGEKPPSEVQRVQEPTN
jgi:ADP-heptose:LPS heptosyltransferase